MFHRLRQGWLSAALAVLAALVTTLLLSGCAFAPGGHIESRVDSAPIDDLVNIRPITPGLVASYREAMGEDRHAHPMSAELRQAIDDYEYRVGAGDVLTVVVYDHPELTIPAGSERSAEESGNRVSRDGSIFYPFIGRVQVAGKTLDEIRRQLARQLTDYIAEPQVDVRVADFRAKKVYVSGAVTSPGVLPITTEPMTVMDAIGLSGGATENANWHNIVLNRAGDETPLSLYALMRQGDQRQNRLLRDGDTLHVPTAEDQGVAVMGQVRTPGNVALGNERITLTDAVSRAGGILENSAEPSGIFVIRNEPQGSDKLATVYQLDISNATAFTLGSRFPLQPSDVIYVTTAPLARWNRVISLLLPSVSLPGNVADSTTNVTDL